MARLSSHPSDASRRGPLLELPAAPGDVLLGPAALAGARQTQEAARMGLSIVSHLFLAYRGHLVVGRGER